MEPWCLSRCSDQRYWLDDEGSVVWCQAEVQFFLLSTAFKMESGAHSASRSVDAGGSWPEVKWSVHGAVHSVPQVLRRIRGGKPPLFYVSSRRAVQLSTGRAILLLLSSSSSSPLCKVFILIFLRQTMSLGNTVLQLFCCYYSWCLYR